MFNPTWQHPSMVSLKQFYLTISLSSFIFMPTIYSTVLLRITGELQSDVWLPLSPFLSCCLCFLDLLAALDTINHSLSLQNAFFLWLPGSHSLLESFLFLISKCGCAQAGPSPQPSFFYTLSCDLVTAMSQYAQLHDRVSSLCEL